MPASIAASSSSSRPLVHDGNGGSATALEENDDAHRTTTNHSSSSNAAAAASTSTSSTTTTVLPSNKPSEVEAADVIGRSFYELLGYCAPDLDRFAPIPPEYDPRVRILQDRLADEDHQHSSSSSAAARSFVSADHVNLYHHPDVDFDYLRSHVTVVENLAFRSSDYNLGKLQLSWIDLVEPYHPEDDDEEEEEEEEEEIEKEDNDHHQSTATVPSRQEQQEKKNKKKKKNKEESSSSPSLLFDGGAKIKGKADIEEEAIAAACPRGYGIAVVYFPPKSDKCYDKIQDRLDRLVPQQSLIDFTRAVHGSMEMSFNQFQWLLSPPVESYETPGLIHFIAVDRKDNSSVCGSFERMRHQRSPEVRLAVLELQRIMAQCISKSHELVSQGFSEGLWGHLGMQFFYSIGTVSTSSSQAAAAGGGAGGGGAAGGGKGNNDRAPPGSNNNNGNISGAVGGASGSGTSANQPQQQQQAPVALPGLFGSSDARKIPSNVLEHLVLRPMLLPDVMAEDKQMRIGEIYCLFVGCLSAQEVCSSVEWLRNSRLFN
jgi:hypothetical protein